MSEITPERLKDLRKEGFANSLAASDLSDEEIKSRVEAYDSQLEKEAAHTEGIRSAVVAAKQSEE